MKFIIFFPLVILLLVLSPIIFFWAYFLPQSWQTQILKITLKIWCKSILLSFGIRLRYCKKPSASFIKKPLLILSNHQSYMDIALLIYLFQCGFILKSSLMFTPFGWSAVFLGSISLRRTSISSFKQTRKKCEKRLRQGVSLCLFPEGTRSNGEKLLPFKRGLLDFYYQNQTPTLVLAHYGSHLILPKNSFFPAFGKTTVAYNCGIIEPKNYASLKQFIEACQQETALGLKEAKNIYTKIHQQNKQCKTNKEKKF